MKKSIALIAIALYALTNPLQVCAEEVIAVVPPPAAKSTETELVKEVPTLTAAMHYGRPTLHGYDDVETPTLSALDEDAPATV